MNKFAVIMAGGSGTRLWPLSRETTPKQFISIDNENCMLVKTIKRVCEILPSESCYIVTNKNLLGVTWETVNGLIPYSNIILEPERKNTAACITYATLFLRRKYKEGIVCFIPADGYVNNDLEYKNTIEYAYDISKTNSILVVGIEPTYPATGYGYIKVENSNKKDELCLTALQFIEKPDVDTASQYVLSQEYFWSCGIIAGRIDVIAESIKTFLPMHYFRISDAIEHSDDDGNFSKYLINAYKDLQNISFEKGVLEKSKSIKVIRGLFDWDDIGSIDALYKTLDIDEKGNSIRGKHFGIDTSNSVIVGNGILIATIDIDNLIIVSTKDAILVCPRNKAQDVKILVEKLRMHGYQLHL